MDPVMHLFLLMVGLTDVDRVSSVGWVTVQRGGSVTIPCFYEDSYKTNVKYWCRGRDWSSCSPIIRTDPPHKKDEVSIRDDPDQRVFTVTMNNLTAGDSGYYWCGVEISRGSPVVTWVYLSVTVDVSTLSWVTVHSGGSVIIPCPYDGKYKTSVKYWCRGSDWSSCTPIVRTDSPQKKDEVSIRDDSKKQVFNVTMNNLKTGDSGYYWCGVDTSRGSAVGTRVYLSVTEETTTASAAVSTTKMVLQTVSVHDEEGGNNEKQKWEQVLDAALKAGTGVLYLICTIIAIQLHCSTCKKRGSNQREAEGGANTNHGS
ncbi:polymeric immunoglobulin receptor-like [Paramormyrops kingsleyae]|uniref:polymeric immunoglobulin receptor-like n=1 Tax=Paramormyrops kingsleyae TaxID=1676925 RepID=UPI003B96E32A